MDNAPCLYFSAGDDGIITEANNTLCSYLGYSKEELVGRNVEMIFTVPTRIFQQTHLFPLVKMQGHAEEIFLTLLTRKKEQLPVLINAKRRIGSEAAISMYAGIVVQNRKKFEDELVAARKTAEEALNKNIALQQAREELQKRAEQLDRQMFLVSRQNEELRQFNRVVTHDLQEPLRKLMVFTSLMMDNRNRQPVDKIIQKIRKVSEQMRSVTSGLQQYIWLTETPVNIREVDLGRLLLQVRKDLETEHPDVAIHIESDALPTIPADRKQMQFLLHEILTNAVRFRKQANEARIHISAKNLMRNTFKAISEKYKYAGYLKLEISDEGVSFDPAYKEQAFELFKKFHPESGLGVGLSLCKKIIDSHGGSIAIEGQEGQGTKVSLWLPLGREEILPG